jgi:molybdopterin-guanine dinucleotide biosynthesis protein MobB
MPAVLGSEHDRQTTHGFVEVKERMIQVSIPVIGICGLSESGKTSLIEAVTRNLVKQGLRVAVIKHDVHGMEVDRPGKDSDRLFKSGADVVLTDPGQSFFRSHLTDKTRLADILTLLAPFHDLILVEGHKSTPVPNKVWLLKDAGDRCPAEATGVTRELKPDEDRVGIVGELANAVLQKALCATPLYAGILIGGQSGRMGRPKQLIAASGRTWLEQMVEVVQPFVKDVVLLGKGTLPTTLGGITSLPDVPARSGPIAGMLSALRWNPFASWLFLACDMPKISRQSVAWLLATRKPGVWATIPKSPEGDHMEPLFAHYDFRAGHLLETCDRPSDLASLEKVATPTPPADIEEAWTNVNTPDDLKKLRK